MCIRIMKHSIFKNIKGAISDKKNAKAFMKSISEHFIQSNKAELSTLLGEFTNIRYNGQGIVREHIMIMSNLGSKNKAHGMNIFDDYLVHCMFNSLLTQFGPL